MWLLRRGEKIGRLVRMSVGEATYAQAYRPAEVLGRASDVTTEWSCLKLTMKLRVKEFSV